MTEPLLLLIVVVVVVIVVGPYIGHVLCAIAEYCSEEPLYPECFDCNKDSCKGCIIRGGD